MGLYSDTISDCACKRVASWQPACSAYMICAVLLLLVLPFWHLQCRPQAPEEATPHGNKLSAAEW